MALFGVCGVWLHVGVAQQVGVCQWREVWSVETYMHVRLVWIPAFCIAEGLCRVGHFLV